MERNFHLYELLCDSLTNAKLLSELNSNPNEFLNRHGVAESDHEQFLRLVTLLHRGVAQENEEVKDMRKFIKDQRDSTSLTADNFKAGLQKTIKQIDLGFRLSMIMYVVASLMGVLLIVAGISFGFLGRETLLSTVLSGLGITNIVGVFVTNPPKNLQSSRADLAQLQAAIFNWFVDLTNWNSILLAKGGHVDFNQAERVSTTLYDRTERTMSLIQKYCEPNPK